MSIALLAGIGAIATGGPSLFPQLEAIPAISWALIGTAGVALVWLR